MIVVHRAAERFVTRDAGRTTAHSFSFGHHYDPANLGFAAMVAHNDEHLPPGTGYPDHRHADTEIVTWVLSGALRHTDDSGAERVLLPGDVQRTSAGSGIVHAEVAAADEETRFLQTWLRPDEPGVVPSHAVGGGAGAGLTEVVGPDALGIGTAGARLHLLDGATGTHALPDAPSVHLFVVSGTVALGEHLLAPGDAARLAGEGGRDLRLDGPVLAAIWSFGG